MGCIQSKAIARSMSIRDELGNHGFQSSPGAWEELLSSHGGTDQLLAFVCSATNRPSNSTLPSANAPEGDDNCPAVPLDGDPEVGRDYDGFNLSKRHDSEKTNATSSEEIENKLEPKDTIPEGSRSFHTVEEYDALLQRIRKFSTRHIEDCTSPEDAGKDILNRDSVAIYDDLERVIRVDSTREMGWKRKAMAKGLAPLDLPTIDFPGVQRNAHADADAHAQLVGAESGQIYSADTYMTPKFGSYNGRVDSRMHKRDGDRDSPVFSRELLAAFEDCMQQLQEDEASILCQMDEGSSHSVGR